MKKSLIAVAVWGAFAGVASAEDQKDGAVLYGVLDVALRHTTNVSAAGASYTGFSDGFYNGSRVGIKGEEKLDNGMKALYNLEAGIVLGNGANDQQGQLFSRASWAGLKHDTYGVLTFGRQYGNFSDAIGTGDVFSERHPNMVYASANNSTNFPNEGSTVSENGFFYQEMGYRWDNSILYANKISAVKFSLMHSYQGQTQGATPAATTANSYSSGNKETMNSVALGYVSRSFNLTASYQTEHDALGFKHNDAGFGANYMYGEKSGVYLFYFTSKYDAGFARIGLGTNSMLSAAATVTARQDKIAALSINGYVTDNLNLIAAAYHDSASNVLVAGDTGSRMGELITADYYLSKNTDTYVAAAHTTLKNALIGNGNGGNTGIGFTPGLVGQPASVNTVVMGMRHRF